MYGKWGEKKKKVIDLRINTSKVRVTLQSSVRAPVLKKVNTVTDAETKKGDRLCYRNGKPSANRKRLDKLCLFS